MIRHAALEDIRKILIVNLGGVGDVLLSLPALRALKKRYPGAKFIFLGVPRTCGVAQELSVFDEVIPFALYEEKTRSFRLTHFKGLVSLLVALRREKFDVAVNMRTIVSWLSAFKMAFVFFAIGARIAVGRNTGARGFFFDLKVPEELNARNKDKTEKHEMLYDLETARLLGADTAKPDLEINMKREDVERIGAFLKDQGIGDSDTLIGLHMGGLETRRWPVAHFARLIEKLSQHGFSHFVVTGQKGEENLLNALRSEVALHLIDAVGKTTFGELTALIKRCDLLVTNDTGPMHIAAMLDRPLVAIFGGGPLSRYDPRVLSPQAAVFYTSSGCWPCERRRCCSLDCLIQISADRVCDVVLQRLKGQAAGGEFNKIYRVPFFEKIYLWARRSMLKPEDRHKPSAGFWQELIRQEAVELCRGFEGRFLEIGCGEGLFLGALARQDLPLELYGIDFEPEALLKAKEYFRQKGLEGIQILKADACRIPFEDGYFDSIACLNVFYSMPLARAEQILIQAGRVLKPQGRIIFDFKNIRNPLLHLKYKLVDCYDSSLRKSGITLTMFDPDDVKKRVSAIGFEVVREVYKGFPLKSLAPIVLFEVRKK